MVTTKRRKRLDDLMNALPSFSGTEIKVMDSKLHRPRAFIDVRAAEAARLGTAHCANLRPPMNDIMGHG